MPHVQRKALVNELPPETTGALTFHLPMEMVALADAGATPEQIDEIVEVRLAEAFAAGVIDPPLYRWGIERYRDVARRLLDPEAAVRCAAFSEVVPLGEGLAGAAFHGLIRLGYGCWQRDEGEIARGLAYLRSRRQVLAGPCPPGAGPSGLAEPPVPPGLADAMPDVSDQAGVTVFDLLNLVAGTGVPGLSAGVSGPANAAVSGSANPVVRDAPSPVDPAALAAEAVALVARNPSSFVAVHALTGLHALVEVDRLVGGAPPSVGLGSNRVLVSWWTAMAVAVRACSVLMAQRDPEAEPAGDPAQALTIDEVVARSPASGETHDVKLAVALRRLVRFGLLDEAVAVQCGIRRLAAHQLG